MNKHTIYPLLTLALSLSAFAQNPPAPRLVNLKSADATPLTATYFAAAKPGPGVLLLHQSNRDRKSWDGVAGQFAAVGFNTSRWTSAGSAKAAARMMISSACLKMLIRRSSS